MTTGSPNCKSELGDIHKKHDMIKQLQEKLNQMKPSVGRGGVLNNEKNMSQIRCMANTYQKAYPQMVKARHMQLSFDDNNDDQRLVTDASDTGLKDAA